MGLLQTGSELPDLLKTVMVEGKIWLAVEQQQDIQGNFTGYYRTEEYIPAQLHKVEYALDGSVKSLTANVVIVLDGKDFVKRVRYTQDEYTYWSPVPVSQAHLLDKNPPLISYPHGYMRCPVVEIKNNATGTPEFSVAALEMATEVALLMCAGAENMRYFGSQILAAPDVKGTLMAIKNRLRVIQKLPQDEGGSAEAIDIKALPENFEYFLKQLLNNLGEDLGTPVVELNLNSDVSSMALKLVYAPAIATGNKKWASVIDDPVFRFRWDLG
jgi:hypothetical protein